MQMGAGRSRLQNNVPCVRGSTLIGERSSLRGIKFWVKRADRLGHDYLGVPLVVPADGDDLKRAALAVLLPRADFSEVTLHRVLSDSEFPTPDEERTALASPRFRPEKSVDSFGGAHFLVEGLGGRGPDCLRELDVQLPVADGKHAAARFLAARAVASPHAMGSFDQGALLNAAHAFYAKEDECVKIEFADIRSGRVDHLPFVNRVSQLDRASQALLHNTSLALSGGDTQKYELVFCSQLFGAGKTSFAKRLAVGLDAAFGGALSYVRLVGVQFDAPTLRIAFARMLIDAARQDDIISRVEAESLLSGSCSFTEALKFVQNRLVENVGVPGVKSQLFLHLDEFDLSSPALLQSYETLRTATTTGRYDIVWTALLVSILQSPNLHLVVTGRPPELSLLGTREDGPSPTLAYHAVLGTLGDRHITDILHRLTVQMDPGPDAPFLRAFSALGLPVLPATSATGFEGIMDPRWSAFVHGLRCLTAGVPRFVCMALGQLLEMRMSGKLCALSGLSPSAIAALFKAGAPLRVAMSSGIDNRFVTGPVGSLKSLLSDPATTDTTVRDLVQLMLNVFGQYAVPLHSDAGRAMIVSAARFGAYTDHVDPDSASPALGPEMIRLAMPDILQEYWRSPEVHTFLAAHLPAFVRNCTCPVLASAGALGDTLELRFQRSLDFHWALSESKSETAPAFLRLLQSSSRFRDLDIAVGVAITRVQMGKMGNAGETAKSANVYVPDLFDECLVGEERHVVWTPRAQSHSADRMCSLVVKSSVGTLTRSALSAPVSEAALVPTQRALLGFALKNYAEGSMTEAVVHREICNFADTVYSLTPVQRALYGSRVVLFLFAPESTRAFWNGLKQSEGMIFPLVVGSTAFEGVPHARGVKFSDLSFDVVVVPQGVADDFMLF